MNVKSSLGYVLARVLETIADTWGKLGEVDEQMAVLDCLLQQSWWRASRFALWSQKRALILLTKHSEQENLSALFEAQSGLASRLEDPSTHLGNEVVYVLA